MPRPKVKINPICGKRLKELCKEQKITQTKLSEIIFITQQTLSKIVNGECSLTEQTARKIVNIFPIYRIEWLMGLDDYKTEAEACHPLLKESLDGGEAVRLLFASFGYMVTIESLVPLDYFNRLTTTEIKTQWNEIKTDIERQENNRRIYIRKSGNIVGECSALEFNILTDEIIRFAKFRLSEICKTDNTKK